MDDSEVGMLVRETIRRCLTRRIEGAPGLIVSPACRRLRKALAGGYHFERYKVSGAAQFKEVPAKDGHSHIVDALQYALMGAGEGRALTRRANLITPAYSVTGDPMSELETARGVPARRVYGPTLDSRQEPLNAAEYIRIYSGRTREDSQT